MNREINTDNVKAQMRKGFWYSILSILSRGDEYASSLIKILKDAG